MEKEQSSLCFCDGVRNGLTGDDGAYDSLPVLAVAWPELPCNHEKGLYDNRDEATRPMDVLPVLHSFDSRSILCGRW